MHLEASSDEEKVQVQLNLSDTHMRSGTESSVTSPPREDTVDQEISVSHLSVKLLLFLLHVTLLQFRNIA